MPRHLISDAHEWINEVPSVPSHYLTIFFNSLTFRVTQMAPNVPPQNCPILYENFGIIVV